MQQLTASCSSSAKQQSTNSPLVSSTMQQLCALQHLFYHPLTLLTARVC
jgi:hypothetical protein